MAVHCQIIRMRNCQIILRFYTVRMLFHDNIHTLLNLELSQAYTLKLYFDKQQITVMIKNNIRNTFQRQAALKNIQWTGSKCNVVLCLGIFLSKSEQTCTLRVPFYVRLRIFNMQYQTFNIGNRTTDIRQTLSEILAKVNKRWTKKKGHRAENGEDSLS